MHRTVKMSINRTILILIVFYVVGTIFATDNVKRKGKFLGITGYLSGSSNGYHSTPFWKQWNALLQVNIEKNRHHGIIVIPTSALYYPSYGGYGAHSPHSLAENNLAHANFLRPMFFDEYKLPPTTTLNPYDGDPLDKPKFDFVMDNELNDVSQIGASDPNVSVFNLNMRDDRKTHKRDIEHKNETDAEDVVATVMEVTATNSDTDMAATTSAPSTNESSVQTTTETTSETTITTTTPLPFTSTSAPTEMTTLKHPTTEISPMQSAFQPIWNVYYGGAPNEQANYVYFTTEQPQMAADRNDFDKFRPSIQYEYQNYRYNTDNHFVPIVGAKQIF